MTMVNVLDRRRFLTLAGSLPLAFAPVSQALAAAPALGRRTLILVELNGGNDGLNTVVPYADPAYAKLRPRIGIARERVLQLDERLGLHPSLEPLMELWKERRLGVALGVGYPEPNLSHFRSIEIWNTGSDSAELRDDGWVGRALADAGLLGAFAADGVVLGDRSETGPLFGPRMNVLGMDSPENFVRRANQMNTPKGKPANPALAHVVDVQNRMKATARTMLEKKLDEVDAGGEFPRNGLGNQLRSAARIVAGGVDVPAIKVSLTGFDTHRGQIDSHARLLKELADGLLAFARAMEAKGLWDKILVMTYAEFGRRAGENANEGTDHGTAAPHFILGGRVKGGLYGQQPRLDDLEDGNLRHGMHYRSLVATATRQWWGLKTAIAEKPLNCIA
jgi:uncharacterized protein (DUF1501 family)